MRLSKSCWSAGVKISADMDEKISKVDMRMTIWRWVRELLLLSPRKYKKWQKKKRVYSRCLKYCTVHDHLVHPFSGNYIFSGTCIGNCTFAKVRGPVMIFSEQISHLIFPCSNHFSGLENLLSTAFQAECSGFVPHIFAWFLLRR